MCDSRLSALVRWCVLCLSQPCYSDSFRFSEIVGGVAYWHAAIGRWHAWGSEAAAATVVHIAVGCSSRIVFLMYAANVAGTWDSAANIGLVPGRRGCSALGRGSEDVTLATAPAHVCSSGVRWALPKPGLSLCFSDCVQAQAGGMLVVGAALGSVVLKSRTPGRLCFS